MGFLVLWASPLTAAGAPFACWDGDRVAGAASCFESSEDTVEVEATGEGIGFAFCVAGLAGAVMVGRSGSREGGNGEGFAKVREVAGRGETQVSRGLEALDVLLKDAQNGEQAAAARERYEVGERVLGVRRLVVGKHGCGHGGSRQQGRMGGS